MRRREKRQVEEFIKTLHQAHDEVRKQIESNHIDLAQEILGECQNGTIQLGGLIEAEEGDACPVIPILEDYCELLYLIYDEIAQGKEIKANKIYKRLHKQLIYVENSVKADIKERLEIVFLPYKVSMWDSLESVWMAADADENCDAYVVPIPYYERNPDGSLGSYHYEGGEMPDYVPVIYYDNYSLEKRRPDIIYIHNPYDDYNYVTSIDPRYYSKELKKHTDTLVYIPYYSTSGGMSEAQMFCPAYYHADYIIIQAEKYRRFFDFALPDNKFKALGSPKFDRIIRICNNPPEPPDSWKEKLDGRKVYFYNTSINGMLGETEAFLKKMKYVFECFKGRDDICLLWRPHPLLESTMASMRLQEKQEYDELKRYFLKNNLGIYDDTSDIAATIAVCDAYIGDAATSVASLFGIAGKPVFILDNTIHSLPETDDWRGKIIAGFSVYGNAQWMITQGNKLYYSENKDFNYKFFCDLSNYAYGSYYLQVITIGEKHYVCPANARDILVINDGKIEKQLVLAGDFGQAGAFYDAFNWKGYIFLIPNNYPAIVKYDTEKDKVCYLDQNLDVFIKYVDGEKRIGGGCIYNGYLYLASPTNNQLLEIDVETCEERLISLDISHTCGCKVLIPNDKDLWLLPYDGHVITRWNTVTGEIQEYADYPEGLVCKHMMYGYQCSQLPFSIPAFCGEYVYFPPQWANMFVRLNKRTGEMSEWKPPMELPVRWENEYFLSREKSYFLRPSWECNENEYLLFSIFDRKLYFINMETEEFKEIPVKFSQEELKKHEPGFHENSEWLQYACEENAFNTLTDFVNGTLIGDAFDKERQLRAYCEIAANSDGTCGEKTHLFTRWEISGR